MTTINGNICLRVLFTGLKVHYKELELTFGDYLEVFDGTDNTSKTRTIPCIAIYPCANVTCSWLFLNLITKKRIRRSQWICVKTMQLVNDALNNFDGIQISIESVDLKIPTPSELKIQEFPEIDPQEIPKDVFNVIKQNINDNVQDNNLPDMEFQVDKPEGIIKSQINEETVIKPRRSVQLAERTKTVLTTKINKAHISDSNIQEAIKTAEIEEILMLFVQLQVLQPLYKNGIWGVKPLNCHLFTVEKVLANGEHDKMKSWMIANENEQDPKVYLDWSSPTIAMHSVLTCLAASACNCFKITKIDIKGAFIQTEMKGMPVYIKCWPTLAKLIVKCLPGINKHIDEDGMLYCRLLKALYGCF